MKFITINYESKVGKEIYKVNLEQVHHIEIYDNRIEFIFRDNYVAAVKEKALNFEEIREIVENL